MIVFSFKFSILREREFFFLENQRDFASCDFGRLSGSSDSVWRAAND